MVGRITAQALGALLALGAHTIPAQAQQVTLIRGASVFDGATKISARDVLIRDGLIADIGNGIALPAGARLVEGAGMTLLPGLIDAHSHAFGDGLRDLIAFGVTTTFDQFTEARMASAVKAQQARGELSDQADLYSAGTLVTAPRGHGTEYGMAIPTIESPDSAQAFVDARIAEGSDWIKIVYDGGKAYALRMPSIDKATLRAVIEAAHRRGKLAVVHIGDMQSAIDAIESGTDGLVHLFLDQAPSAGFAGLLRQHRAFVIPTLSVLESVTGASGGGTLLADPRLAPGISAGAADNLKKSFPVRPGSPARYAHAEETVRQLKAAGVPILAGTDPPNPGTWYGVSLHRELELLVKAGLTPSEALASATSVAARAFRFSDRGRIAKGLRADLLLVKGDPTTDILATRAIEGIWKRGVALDRAKFLVARAAENAAAAAAAATPALALGLVSDFEDGTPKVSAGAGWIVTTDAMIGGSSKATMNVVDGGAAGTGKSLGIEGTVAAGAAIPWSGVMHFPGQQQMQPADLSANKEIRFWARGDGRSYAIMVFSQSKGMQPIVRPFVAGAEWKEYVFKFTDFDGITGHDVSAIAFTAGNPAGAFAFRIDQFTVK